MPLVGPCRLKCPEKLASLTTPRSRGGEERVRVRVRKERMRMLARKMQTERDSMGPEKLAKRKFLVLTFLALPRHGDGRSENPEQEKRPQHYLGHGWWCWCCWWWWWCWWLWFNLRFNGISFLCSVSPNGTEEKCPDFTLVTHTVTHQKKDPQYGNIVIVIVVVVGVIIVVIGWRVYCGTVSIFTLIDDHTPLLNRDRHDQSARPVTGASRFFTPLLGPIYAPPSLMLLEEEEEEVWRSL